MFSKVNNVFIKKKVSIYNNNFLKYTVGRYVHSARVSI